MTTTGVPRVALATLACAVLSGADPRELRAENEVDQVSDIVQHVRRLSTNTTGDTIPTTTWAAIIGGAVAVVIILVGLICLYMRQTPLSNTPAGKVPVPATASRDHNNGIVPYDPPRNFNDRFFVAEGASAAEQAELPLLNMPAAANGARECDRV